MTTTTIDRTVSIGGSDVAAILGISPFRTPLDVWREKVLGQRDTIDTPATRAGERFEPHVLAAYSAQLPAGSKVEKPNPTVDGYRRASPDGIATVGGWPRLVEIKTTIFGHDWGSDGSEGIPLHYAMQAMWYLDLLQIEEADFPVLLWPYEMRDLLGLSPAEIVAECETRTLRLRYSATAAASMRDAVDRFWRENVLAKVPPPSRDLADAKRLVWSDPGSTREADEELIGLMLRRDEIKATAKAVDADLEKVEHEIRERIGANEVVVQPRTGKPLMTCKVIHRAGYTANVAPTSYRPLTMTKTWKEMQK